MATDSTEVINLALSRLGQKEVASIDDNTSDAKTMKSHYTGTVYEVLSILPWNCAVKRASLEEKTGIENLTDYEYAYDLPEDSIRILDIDGDKSKGFRIEGQQIYTDEGDGEPAKINVRYISKLEEVPLWDELLQETIVIRLAEKAAMKITQNLNYTAYLQNEYISILTIARQSANSEDREDISDIISSLNNAKLADILLAKNNYQTG